MRSRTSFRAICAASILALAGCAPLESERERERERQMEVERQSRAAAPAGVVQVSAAAQKNIGLAVAKASRRPVQDSVAAAGWLMARPGSEITVKAPATGFVVPANDQQKLVLGAAVTGPADPFGSLQVFLSPQDQATLVAAKTEAETLLRQSQVNMQFAEAQLERLKRTENVVAGTRLAELQETVERARAAYEGARERLPFLPKEASGNPLRLKPIPLAAPLGGRIIRLRVAPGQLVVQGDELWTIADWSALWVRVPVFQEDLTRISPQQPAQVALPGTTETRAARRVKVAQPTEAGQRTIDLFYEIDNPKFGQDENPPDTLRSGQAVAVSLSTGRAAQQVVVPRAAIVWDGMGNTWVYVQAGPERFRRQRVELGPVLGDAVAITRGLREGEPVVSVAAEALYGEEFKSEIPGEEEGK